uniref:RHS repeat-associated core domain-containing protein n=1 Tax=Burkholderia cepacia TaxID=292 RepID=UPI00158CD631
YRYDPVGRLLEAQSRLGHETFAFDPAGNLIDPAEQREAERQRMPRIKALDNLLKQYAGTHYQYDAWGNLSKHWHQGKESRYAWDLFDRLTHYEDERLAVDYTYDALGRRLSKYSKAHYEERREAGPHWNRAERVKRNRDLQCGFTLYGWDGDTLAWESKIADEDGFGARTTHYVYEPGSFVPVAQAVRQDAILLLDQPEYGDYYRQDEDPLWMPPPPAPPIDGLAWYQCDHLGTPQELTDEHSEIVWSAEYRAWGAVKEVVRKASDGRVELRNPIRFQGQYHDHETGLHYNRHRYYDPRSGRFVSKDPIGLVGGINLYEYVRNPLTWIDPLGLQASGPVLLGMGHLYRASTTPPLPSIARIGEMNAAWDAISNFPWMNDLLPGEWVGVNVPWSMPNLDRYCADGYYGESPLSKIDNSNGSCKAPYHNSKQAFVSPDGGGKKFTCTKWVIYEKRN